MMPTKRTRTSKPRSPALKHLYKRFVEGDKNQQAAYDKHLSNAAIARKLYDLRNKAGLSQRELAKMVGTTASVICRLEDVNYEGHSLSMLRRVAAALNARVEIRLLPAKQTRRPA